MKVETAEKEIRKIGVITKTIWDFRIFCDKNDLKEMNHSGAISKDGKTKYLLVSSIERSRGSEFHDTVIFRSGNEFKYSEIQYFKTRVRLL